MGESHRQEVLSEICHYGLLSNIYTYTWEISTCMSFAGNNNGTTGGRRLLRAA